MVRIFSRFPSYRRSKSKNIECSIKIDEDGETSCGGSSGLDHVMEFDLEFKPVAHPLEPPNNDGPVRCPMPEFSIFTGGGRRETHTIKSLNKKVEKSATRKGKVVAAPRPPKHALLTLSRNQALPLLFESTQSCILLMLQNRIHH